MLEKIQEEFYKQIRKGLLDQTSVEIPFKHFLMGWFPKQRIEDRVLTRALLDFDKKYNLDHIIVLSGKQSTEELFFTKRNGKWLYSEELTQAMK